MVSDNACKIGECMADAYCFGERQDKNWNGPLWATFTANNTRARK